MMSLGGSGWYGVALGHPGLLFRCCFIGHFFTDFTSALQNITVVKLPELIPDGYLLVELVSKTHRLRFAQARLPHRSL